MAKKNGSYGARIVPVAASGSKNYLSVVQGSVGSALSARLPATNTVQHTVTIPVMTGCEDAPLKALDVARYLIYLAAAETEPEFLTHMRLQKLLYYVQGWSLALRHKPMFSERIEAWAHGPVVVDLYPHFAEYGDGPIQPRDVIVSDGLSPDDRELIESVWSAYKAYSTSSLRSMTHSEAPWKDARGKCGPADRCATEITQKTMKRFFLEASRRHGP